MKCIFADYKVEILDNDPKWGRKYRDYLADFEQADFSFDITKEDIEKEKVTAENKYLISGLKYAACLRKLGEKLPFKNAFVFHAATLDVEGVGVAFAARSGTGKSTHMALWQQLLGDKMVIVNGDKPIVRYFDEEPNTPYAYGTPWNGKEAYGCNMRTPLKHICFIERSAQNSVEKIEPKEAIEGVLNQIYMPKTPLAVANTIGLINRLSKDCQFWKIKCNMELDAAQVAYNTIFNR